RCRRSLSLAHSIALSFGGDDGCMVSESIEKRGGELLVAGEDRHPFGERQIRRDDDASPLVALREEIEEQFAAGAIERDEAELAHDQYLHVREPPVQARELTMIARLDEREHEIGGTCEQDTPAVTCRLDSEGDCKMGLPRADRAREDEIIGARDP